MAPPSEKSVQEELATLRHQIDKLRREVRFLREPRSDLNLARDLVDLGIVRTAKLKQTNTQTLTTATWTVITMDATDWALETEGSVDLTNDLFTVQRAGIYLVTGVVCFASAAAPGTTHSRYAAFRINGGTDVTASAGGFRIADGATIRVHASAQLSLGIGATVQLLGYQDSGGNLNTAVVTAPDVQSQFAVTILAAS